jgi:pimeloyl-ACP methyl ester carboxylesterase
MFLVSVVLIFGTTVQDITSTLWTRLKSETKRTEAELKAEIPFETLSKAFLIIEDEASETVVPLNRRYLFCLFSTREEKEYLLPSLDEIQPDSSHRKTAANYTSLQNAFLYGDTVSRSTSVYDLLSSKIEYFHVFLDELEQLQTTLYEPYKKNKNREEFARYLSHLYQSKKRVFQSLPSFFSKQQIVFPETSFEPAIQDLIQQSLIEWHRLLDSVYTPLQLSSIVSGTGIFLEGLVLNPDVPVGKTVSDWMSYIQSMQTRDIGIKSPYRTVFFDKANTVFADLQVALVLDIQRDVAVWIQTGLQEMVKQVSRDFGMLSAEKVEDVLLGCFLFDLFSYWNMNLLEKYGNVNAHRHITDLYNPGYFYDQDITIIFPYTRRSIESELGLMTVGISDVRDSHLLFQASLETAIPKMVEIKIEKPIVHALPTAELVQFFELENPEGHFAEIEMSVQVGANKSDSFTKVFPVFSSAITKSKPLVVLDFFWFALKQWGRTLGKLLGVILNNSIDLLEVEKRLEVKNIQVTVNRYFQMQPYAELWRMLPAKDQNIFVTLRNNNTEKNAVASLFGGVVPDFLAGDVDVIPSDPVLLIHRYPVEAYASSISIRSALPRKRNALIVVHGKQALPYFDQERNVLPNAPYIWRTSARMNVWDHLFSALLNEEKKPDVPLLVDDFDIYEFVYDTSIFTVKEYGKILAEILYRNNFLNDYLSLFLVGHSMGGIVIREAANTRLPDSSEGKTQYLGNYVSALVTLDSPHYGSVLENFVYTVNTELKTRINTLKVPVEGIQMSLLDVLRALLRGEYIEQSINMLLSIVARNPELVGKLFTEMVPFLDPLPGGVSLCYTDDAYMEAISGYLYGKTDDPQFRDLLKASEILKSLNTEDRFYDRLFLFTSVIDENSPVSQGTYPLLYGLMKRTAQIITFYTNRNYMMHEANDAVVSLYSQQMAGRDAGQTRVAFRNIDHTAVPMTAEVLSALFGILSEPMTKKGDRH